MTQWTGQELGHSRVGSEFPVVLKEQVISQSRSLLVNGNVGHTGHVPHKSGTHGSLRSPTVESSNVELRLTGAKTRQQGLKRGPEQQIRIFGRGNKFGERRERIYGT